MITRTDLLEEQTGEEETKSFLEDIVNFIRNLTLINIYLFIYLSIEYGGGRK